MLISLHRMRVNNWNFNINAKRKYSHTNHIRHHFKLNCLSSDARHIDVCTVKWCDVIYRFTLHKPPRNIRLDPRMEEGARPRNERAPEERISNHRQYVRFIKPARDGSDAGERWLAGAAHFRISSHERESHNHGMRSTGAPRSLR